MNNELLNLATWEKQKVQNVYDFSLYLIFI